MTGRRARPLRPLPPGTWLGVLGGGQLGRMFAMSAHRLGYRVAVLDPDPGCPAAGAADRLICRRLDDPAGWRAMTRQCAAITIETENVPAEALSWISRHVPVAPDHKALGIAQDRIREKRYLARNAIPVAPFAVITRRPGARAARLAELLPGVLKSSRFGYDGKGQIGVDTPGELGDAFDALGGKPCVLEQRLPLVAEISVILARGGDGSLRIFPVPLNRHQSGILRESQVPAPLPRRVLDRARRLAVHIAESLDYRGVLCVEFFLLDHGRLVVNEIAPRPHNSGHFTLDACSTSQFDQQVRVLAALPLGDPSLRGAATMINLLGDAWQAGEPDWRGVLSQPEARLHLYGKPEPRPGRKMGHITFVAESGAAALRAARKGRFAQTKADSA